MDRRSGVPVRALFAALAGVLALAGVPGCGAGRSGAGGAAAEGGGGAEVLLQGVEFREVRKEGAQYNLSSDEASYLPAARQLTATGVTLRLEEKPGEIVVRAPRASWNLETGRVALPDGVDARSTSGWTAAADDEARLSLPDRVLTAAGRARLAGPGVAVTGENLLWRWREGTVELDFPKTRIEPAGTLRGKG